MINIHQNQVTSLVNEVNKFSNSYGAAISLEVENNSILLLQWIQYLNSYHLTGTADYLIAAIGPSLREVAATLAMGITRPALFSLRSQIDLILTWLYFKDHPKELDYVNSSSDGFKMKKELLTYLGTHYESFGLRYGILKKIATRSEEEPYRFLSAHIHGQSAAVLCTASELHDFVRPELECKDCVKAVHEVSEYINDVLLSVYADNWLSLPSDIRISIESRFSTPNQRAEFFNANKPNRA